MRQALRDPQCVLSAGDADWDLLIRQGRSAGLLARLAVRLDERGILASVPTRPRRHLEADRALADKHRRDVLWELRMIKTALARTGVSAVLLKGAAYALGGLPPACGRFFNDIDVLVPRQSLAAVERALHDGAWLPARLAAYDERYYRLWMHQIPPMTHIGRETTIDVHHTILAPTAARRLQAEKLFAAAVPVPDDGTFKILGPPDMVLHSATHLLNQGEFHRGLRDLDDINLLLRHFSSDSVFWPTLLRRAAELDLQRPLFYALRYASRLLGTPVPDEVLASRELAPPNAPVRRAMDPLFERALRPDHASCRDWGSPFALAWLYMRGHLLLMPPHILLPHLARKAVMRVTEGEGAPLKRRHPV